jgi:hypothetical protein
MGVVESLKRGAQQRHCGLEWGCLTFPNGVWTILFALVLLLTANVLGTYGSFSCRLVTVAGDLESIFAAAAANQSHLLANQSFTNSNVTSQSFRDENRTKEPIESTNASLSRRGVGLLGWEGPNGKCIWSENDLNDVAGGNYTAIREGYLILRGPQWDSVENVVYATMTGIWNMLAWLLSFVCLPYSARIRNMMGVVLLVGLTTAHGLVWRLWKSDFCIEFDCHCGTSLVFVSVAAALTAVTSIAVFLSSSKGYRERKVLIQDPLAEICTLDEEERRRDGFNNAREVAVEGELIDPVLLSPTAAPTPTESLLDTPD